MVNLKTERNASKFDMFMEKENPHVDIDQGIHKGKMKVAQNEKRKKLLGFSFYINMGNLEAFLWNLNLSTKHLFWRCVYIDIVITLHQPKHLFDP